MGRPFLVARPHSFRTFHHIRWRLVLTLTVILLFLQQYLFFVHRQSLAEKYSPTVFDPPSGDQHTRSLRPDDEDAQYLHDLIENYGNWTVLGKGWEGKVFAYGDSVIKTFTPGRSPFRNCAPGGNGEHWPTEITASLRFGGSTANFKSVSEKNSVLNGFLPVKTYFKAAVASTSPEWHLVTPLLREGNVMSLAKRLTQGGDRSNFQEIDAHYRPIFERLINNLGNLNRAGYCHDDIKPANIFVQDKHDWALGDLGNVREVAHPYHSSRLWKDNGQLADCRANDVVRALKSYLKFVQAASADQDHFNEQFLEGSSPTIRMYWRAIAEAPTLSAERLREISFAEYPEKANAPGAEGIFQVVQKPGFSNLFFSSSSTRRRTVNQVLRTRMGEKVARFWGMTWLFGITSSCVCGV